MPVPDRTALPRQERGVVALGVVRHVAARGRSDPVAPGTLRARIETSAKEETRVAARADEPRRGSATAHLPAVATAVRP